MKEEKRIILFDVDGTITESGMKMKSEHITLLNNLKQKYEIGIVGGGTLDKIKFQTEGVTFDHYFTECGSVYHDSNYKLIYEKNIRNHHLYPIMNILVKKALFFLSQVDYMVAGNLIDIRKGLIYISLIGLSATTKERNEFIELDKNKKYRKALLDILQKYKNDNKLKLHIVYGGSVGIAIYPEEYDKVQIMEHFKTITTKIHYFGDKYLPNGNDYLLLNHEDVCGHKINSVQETFNILNDFFVKN